jgi:O-antigen/teichoic acid export membrane protein
MPDVGRKMVTGALWMLLIKAVERSLSLVSTIILARLLLPADFGLVAMAMSFVALLELLSAFGFDLALIQRQQASREHFDTAWTLNVGLGALIASLMVLLAPAVAQFFREPQLSSVIPVLAIALLVQGFENIGVVTFRKELRFQREFYLQAGKRVCVFVVTVVLAALWRDFWALVFGIVTGRVLGVALTYAMHPFRPRFSLQGLRDLCGFSKWMLPASVLGYLREQSAYFLLGRFTGARQVGLYSVGYDVATMPTIELVASINRAAFPGYAAIAEDRAQLARGAVKALGIIGLMAIPAGVGVSAVAFPATVLLLGSAWVDAAPIIGVLGLYGSVAALQTNTLSVFMALGRPDLWARLLFVQVVALVPLLFLLIERDGARGAALACLLAALLSLPFNVWLLASQLRVRAWEFARGVIRPLMGAVAMYGVVTWLQSVAGEPGGLAAQIGWLLLLIGTGVITYAAAVAILWLSSGRPHGAERWILDQCRATLRRTGIAPHPTPGAGE